MYIHSLASRFSGAAPETAFVRRRATLNEFLLASDCEQILQPLKTLSELCGQNNNSKTANAIVSVLNIPALRDPRGNLSKLLML